MHIQRESLMERWHEAYPLFLQNHDEVENESIIGKLNIDKDFYAMLEEHGLLFFVTIRDDVGMLVGYSLYVMDNISHYKGIKCAKNDVLYVHPNWRRGLLVVGFVREAEKMLKAEGIDLILHTTKPSREAGRLFTRMGYEKVETVYGKRLHA